MSHLAAGWAWQQDVSNPVRKLILLHMADSASEQNGWQTWYSLAKIAQRCNCSRGSVRTHLSALVGMGLITLTVQSSRQGKPAKYKLHVSTIKVENDDIAGAGDVPLAPLGGATDIQGGTGAVPEVVQELYGGGTGAVPETVIEPVIKTVSETNKRKLSKTQRIAKKKVAKDLFVLPSWMPEDRWADYLVSRKEKNRPMNDGALKLCIQAIEKTIQSGISLDLIMDQMIGSGWQTCKPEYFVNSRKPETAEERGKRWADAARADLTNSEQVIEHAPD